MKLSRVRLNFSVKTNDNGPKFKWDNEAHFYHINVFYGQLRSLFCDIVTLNQNLNQKL